MSRSYDEVRADWIGPDGEPLPNVDIDADVRRDVLDLIAEIERLRESSRRDGIEMHRLREDVRRARVQAATDRMKGSSS